MKFESPWKEAEEEAEEEEEEEGGEGGGECSYLIFGVVLNLR